ncbi:MAG: hypothetical protein IT212_07525 [Bacteroidia bacterium]|nr:hypothetical protein [Bacteroidia bacterium]
MKQLLILIVLFSSCAEESVPKNNRVESPTSMLDSASVIYSRLIAKITSLKNDVNQSGIENMSLLSEIDSLQLTVIKYQTNSIQLKISERNLAEFIDKNKQLIEDIKILATRNRILSDSNNSIKGQLNSISGEYHKANSALKKLKSSIKFQLANVTIKSFGYKKSLFKKPQLIETTEAKEAKYIEVSFVCVASPNITQGKYTLKVMARGVNGLGIFKPVEVDYVGNEIAVSKRFNEPESFEVGMHQIEILLDNEVLYKGTIELK